MELEFLSQCKLFKAGEFLIFQILARGVFGCADSEYQLEIPDFGHWRALARTC